jgi:hypothetical protein
MSHSKLLFFLLPLGLFVNQGYADSQRPLFSLENAFPRWTQFEVGTTYTATEIDNGFNTDDFQVIAPYVRYGILENFAVQINVPFVTLDPAFGDSESGLGDLEVEFQLRTYEDIFGYPYFIPHVSFTIPTGDEDKGLGNEDSTVVVGMSYGDKINDMLHWILDFSYRINANTDNQFLLSNSYIYDVSERFSLLAELRYEEQTDDSEDSLVLGTGGISYYWNDNLRMGANAGAAITGSTNMYTQISLDYSF